MKATDLMIGDWVKCTDPRCEGHQVDLIDHGNEEVGLDGEIDNFENIIPIPLTPEILEKNFGKPYPRGGFHNYRMEKDETIAFVIEDRRVSAAPDNRVVFCRVPGTYICDVNYVHELQHALRLCGIDKELTLF